MTAFVTSLDHRIFFWGGWSSLVAVGTLALAFATAWLGWQARQGATIAREQADTLKEQLDASWAREWAAQRPVAYPVALPEWAYASEGTRYRAGNARVLPLKNGGAGPALNVRGEVHARTPDGIPYQRQLLAGTIAAGDSLDARLVPHPGIAHWLGAEGVLRYHDLTGAEWQTRFRVVEAPGNEIDFDTEEPVLTETVGEPVLPPSTWTQQQADDGPNAHRPTGVAGLER